MILTLVGVPWRVGIAADAYPGTAMRRNLYNDRAACERDYSPAQCEQTKSGSSCFIERRHGSGGGWSRPVLRGQPQSTAAAGDPGPGRIGAGRCLEREQRPRRVRRLWPRCTRAIC